MHDSSGARGTITFHPNYLVAAFCDDNSERISDNKNALDYFKGSPDVVQGLAGSETLQYLLDDMYGETVPVITTAFWRNSDGLYSKDELDEMIDNGGFLIERQARDIELAINEWQEEYELSDGQIKLLKSIFKRKIEQPLDGIILTTEEVQMIEFDDEEGLAESKVVFEELGIQWRV
ncbi:hypothetical protein [Bacillus sp. TL12]|uniref:hypothetical protein n=1 Tax=Bacillus sp. TL12 TaxID=2894756 RepID=UPI0032206F47